jgi:hypothetical protein
MIFSEDQNEMTALVENIGIHLDLDFIDILNLKSRVKNVRNCPAPFFKSWR